MEFIGFAFLVAAIIWFFPAILAFLFGLLCLVIGITVWLYEEITGPFKKTRK